MPEPIGAPHRRREKGREKDEKRRHASANATGEATVVRPGFGRARPPTTHGRATRTGHGLPGRGSHPLHSPARSRSAESPEATAAGGATSPTTGIPASIRSIPLLRPDPLKNALESLAFAPSCARFHNGRLSAERSLIIWLMDWLEPSDRARDGLPPEGWRGRRAARPPGSTDGSTHRPRPIDRQGSDPVIRKR